MQYLAQTRRNSKALSAGGLSRLPVSDPRQLRIGWLAARFRLSTETAAVVADLAFASGGAR